MRRLALIIILLQAVVYSANAQNDIQLMLDADFSSMQMESIQRIIAKRIM